MQKLAQLEKMGVRQISRTDPDSRFLREAGDHITLGHTADVAVSDDHLIVARRATQAVTDNASLLPMFETKRPKV